MKGKMVRFRGQDVTAALEVGEALTFEDAYVHGFEDRKRGHEKGCSKPLEAGNGKEFKILSTVSPRKERNHAKLF